MNPDILEMLDIMETTFRDFENSMPSKPQPVQLSFGMAYRFREKDIYGAMIQKLVRAQSLARAVLLLSSHGFVQEQGILQRTIDETNEDIMFLVYAVTNDTITDLHQRYLEAFWEEEIDESGTMIGSEQKRPFIPRDRITAYLANIDSDPSTSKEVSRTISKAYSGFVHGASPHIMDMYYGDPPRFHTQGMLGTLRADEYAEDVWNPVYRTFVSYIAVAKALGAKEHVVMLMEHLKRFQKNAGPYL